MLVTAYLFVYGTLRQGSDNKYAHLLSEQAQFVGNTRMPGRLYDFGRYPGVVAASLPDEFVKGEVFRLNDESLLATLDDYEGADFKRVVIEFELAGERQKAWVYLYCGPASGRLIASGDWFQR